jgi:hypothetical protein
MMMYRKYIYISCEKATLLWCKKAETDLNVNEAIRLRFHLFCCKSCAQFAKQIVFIEGKLIDLLQNRAEFKLSPSKKAEIQQMMNDE